MKNTCFSLRSSNIYLNKRLYNHQNNTVIYIYSGKYFRTVFEVTVLYVIITVFFMKCRKSKLFDFSKLKFRWDFDKSIIKSTSIEIDRSQVFDRLRSIVSMRA